MIYSSFFKQSIISFDFGLKVPDIFMRFSLLGVDKQLESERKAQLIV